MNGFDDKSQRPKERQAVDYLADVPHYEQACPRSWEEQVDGGNGVQLPSVLSVHAYKAVYDPLQAHMRAWQCTLAVNEGYIVVILIQIACLVMPLAMTMLILSPAELCPASIRISVASTTLSAHAMFKNGPDTERGV